jgi:hypothetical protein
MVQQCKPSPEHMRHAEILKELKERGGSEREF